MVELTETLLESQRTSPVYRQRLSKGLSLYLLWAQVRGLDVTLLTRRPLVVDQYLCEFVNHAKDQAVPFWLVKHAVLAVQTKWRHLRNHIPRVWDCVRSWQHQRLWSYRVPIPLEVLQALFAVSLSWGFEVSSLASLLIPFAVLLRVGFFALLRPGMLSRLTAGDV